jgi:hypothetical protein
MYDSLLQFPPKAETIYLANLRKLKINSKASSFNLHSCVYDFGFRNPRKSGEKPTLTNCVIS